MILAVAASNAEFQPSKLVTFLGKGGSGKTTAAVFAAQVCLNFQCNRGPLNRIFQSNYSLIN